jgi:hypothetical protein
MAKPMHATRQLTARGAVDADGHILEPPDLWETYLEPKYRDRALRIVRDENGQVVKLYWATYPFTRTAAPLGR